MSDKINIQEIKDKLYAKLKESGWARKLRGFIYSGDFDDIINQLINETKKDKRFTPTFKDLFRFFEECPYDDLKVVILGPEPYKELNVADGIAFSCSKTMKPEHALEYMFRAIDDTVYPDNGNKWNPDLKRWSSQGMLLLNISLTTQINNQGKHFSIWKPFITYLLDVLNSDNNGLVYIFVGSKTQEWTDYINENNYKLICTHPISAAYKGDKKWNCNDVFNKTSKIIKNNYNYDIVW